jgi:hypothetical protein
MEEVATMEIYTMTQLSMLLPAACAPSAVLPATAAAPVAMPVLAAERAPISRVHQATVQAELVPASGRVNEINGTTGFKGLGVSVDSKRYVDERGVPPRGRPV